MNIILIGPPGSGKGTQAKMISSKYNLVHLSSGDIIREQIKANTELGNIAKTYIEQGKLLPDEYLISMIKSFLSKKGGSNGFIFDGFPRTISQAETLEKILAEDDSELNSVIILNVSDKLIMERLSDRRICPVCNAIYHNVYNPPKNPDVCDLDNATLFQRDDDKEETIAYRLNVYHNITKPLIEFYQKKNLIELIDGSLLFDDVFSAITNKLDIIENK